jgi:hypothetical protein
MKLTKTITAAGLTIALGAFAPCVFAAGGAGAAGGGGAPAAGVPGGNTTGSAPAAGQPGTEAPASAAPVGAASSDYMSHEGANASANSSISGPSAQNSETRARWLETKVERDVVAARAKGVNVAKAQHQKWLGSEALSKGDRANAMRHFRIAERDLGDEGFQVSRNSQMNRTSVNENSTSTNTNANDTSQNPSAANMHSNQGTNSSY